MAEARSRREDAFEYSEYEIEYGESSMTWVNSMWARIAALTVAALTVGILLGVVASELTDDDAISAELPAPATTVPTAEQDPGLSEALTAENGLAESQLLVIGGPDTSEPDPQSSTSAEASTSTTTNQNSTSVTTAAASSTASNSTTTATTTGTTTSEARSSTSAAGRTATTVARATSTTAQSNRPSNNSTTTMGSMNHGGDHGDGGTSSDSNDATAGGDTSGDGNGAGSGAGHGGHSAPGSWVKASSESARYSDSPISTTHHIFNPYSSNAPAGWGASRIGFLVHCEPVKVDQIDPIVAPGQAKSAHLHEFFGNPNVTPNSTTQSLANTPKSQIDCTDKNDKSGYWTPTACQNGRLVRADRFKAYYKSPNPNTVPMPFGLRMVAGNAGATSNQPRNVGWWQTTESITTAGKSSMVSRGGAKNVRLRINFPDCWDGVHLDSPDHQSHVAYAKGNKCPSSHPVAIPQVVTFTDYTASGGSGFSLASGPWYTFHQDFWNVWSPDQMEALHTRCNLAEMNCRARSSPDLVPRGQKPVNIAG